MDHNSHHIQVHIDLDGESSRRIVKVLERIATALEGQDKGAVKAATAQLTQNADALGKAVSDATPTT